MTRRPSASPLPLLLAATTALLPGCGAGVSTLGDVSDAAVGAPDLAQVVGAGADLASAPQPDLAMPDMAGCDPSAYPGTLYATEDTLLGDSAPQSLCRYRGRVLLIFNAAELCGFTFETTGLQALQAQYGSKGLEVLGFYSNDFGNQGGDPAACNAKFMVTFDTFEIAPVSGPNARPPYKWLFSQKNPGPEQTTEPQWNFSKYLVGRDGKLVAHWAHNVTPEVPAISAAIEAELAKAPPK